MQKTTLPAHLHAAARENIDTAMSQLSARMTRERRGEMDGGDILDALLAEWSRRDLPQSVTVWIPAPNDAEYFVEAVLRGCCRWGDVVFRLERLEWPAVTRRCGRVEVPMVRATFLAEEVQ